MSDTKLRRRYLIRSNEYFDRAETGIKTIAAVHNQCRSRVIFDRRIYALSLPDVRCCPNSQHAIARLGNVA